MCDIMTDNRNRTAPEIRKIFDVAGGKLGGTGCVSYLFERKGIIVIKPGVAAEEKIMEIAMENGADDIQVETEKIEINCTPDRFTELVDALQSIEIPLEFSQIMRIPSQTVDLDPETAKTVLKLLENLEDHDDVQSVSTNLNITADMVNG
jgi:YebC/PmpR family DNA-binding regulatory protein